MRPPTPTTWPKKKGGSSCDFPYTDDNRSLRLSYPRDISALRSAYEKQSVFAAPRSSGVHAILQDSPEQGDDAGDAGDTIKAFAGPMSAVAQEAVLYGIVSYLRAHHTLLPSRLPCGTHRHRRLRPALSP